MKLWTVDATPNTVVIVCHVCGSWRALTTPTRVGAVMRAHANAQHTHHPNLKAMLTAARRHA